MSIHLIQVQQQSLYDFMQEDINETSLEYNYDHHTDIGTLQQEQANPLLDFQKLIQPQNIPFTSQNINEITQSSFYYNGCRMFLDVEHVLQHLHNPDYLREKIQAYKKCSDSRDTTPNSDQLTNLRLDTDNQKQQDQTTNQNKLSSNQLDHIYSINNSTPQLALPYMNEKINIEINKNVLSTIKDENINLTRIPSMDLNDNQLNLATLNFQMNNNDPKQLINQQKQFFNDNFEQLQFQSIKGQLPPNMDLLKTQSKKIFQWDKVSHLRFAIACLCVGIKYVTPKQLLSILNDSRLDREKVASHLQKFRIQIAKQHNIQVPQLQNTHMPNNINHPLIAKIKAHWEKEDQYPISNEAIKQLIQDITL